MNHTCHKCECHNVRPNTIVFRHTSHYENYDCFHNVIPKPKLCVVFGIPIMTTFLEALLKLSSHPRGDHSLLYFAYTCIQDLFIGGGNLPCKKDYKVMVFYM
jgi:hypothetical protein